MKNIPLFAAFALLFAVTAFGQKSPAPASDWFQLGTKKVRIPAPQGFTEIFSRFDSVVARMKATEDPNNETVTSHLPTSSLAKYEANQEQRLDHYTKVSVSKNLKTTDITPEYFAEVVAETEKQLATLGDPNDQLLKKIEGNSSKGLSELWGKETTVKVNQPKNLGAFDRGPNLYSVLLFVSGDLNGKKYSTLTTISLLRINQRLVWVYTYKMDPTQADIAMLKTFTKKWTAAILAANTVRSRP
jgi:hypothetical protein